MVELMQNKISSEAALSQYDKMDEVSVSINKDLVLKDMDKLNKMMENPKNKFDKANIKGLITYLNTLLKKMLDDSTLEVCWHIKDGMPETYPFNLINERIYGINTCNYIELGSDEKLVEMDMTSLADIIAFEFMSRDLDQTHETIEELLKDCGIIGFEPASLLTNFFKENGDEVYRLSKSMKIIDTPYYSYDNKKVQDYFYSKEFKTDRYADVVEYSCKYANVLIANAIIKNSLHSNVELKLLMVDATNIAFIVNTTDEVNIKQNIIGDISIRTFGRRFQIEPNIQMF